MTLFLASSSTNSSTLTDVEPGLLGFLVVAGLGVSLFFLLRSMNKQFKKIGPRPEDPMPADDDDEAQPDAAFDASADASAAAKRGSSPRAGPTSRAASAGRRSRSPRARTTSRSR